MMKLEKGMKVWLKSGESGVVNEVYEHGYDLLMKETGRYHSVNTDGSCGMFGDPVLHAVDWAKTLSKKGNVQPKKTRGAPREALCEDEGCPHHGTPHICVSKKDALDTQVGGGHYKGFVIQPVEFAMTQGYDFCAASILKYVTRHRQKNGRQDVEKALHFVELREQVVQKHDLTRLLTAYQAVRQVSGLTWVTDAEIDIARNTTVFCRVNGITGIDAEIIECLGDLVNSTECAYSMIKSRLRQLIAEYDSTKE